MYKTVFILGIVGIVLGVLGIISDRIIEVRRGSSRLFMVIGVLALAFSGMVRSIEIKQNNERESLSNQMTYQTYLESGKIIDAMDCKEKDGKKTCKILESDYRWLGSDIETVEVIVEDYWEKEK